MLIDQPVVNNKQNIILVNKSSRETMLINMVIPNKNILLNEHIIEYRDLETQIKKQWRIPDSLDIHLPIWCSAKEHPRELQDPC